MIHLSGYVMEFNSEFNLEKPGTGDCPTSSTELSSSRDQLQDPLDTPEAVQAVYHFAPGHKLDSSDHSESLVYTGAATSCEGDDNCGGYNWKGGENCPSGGCQCLPGVDCQAQF